MSIEAADQILTNMPEDGLDIHLARHQSATEHLLAEARVRESRRLIGGANEVFVVTLDNGTPEGQQAIFKGVDGERDVIEGIRSGTFHLREQAAYLLDQSLGLDLVPMTIIREMLGTIGSLQEFAPSLKEYNEHDPAYRDGLYAVWAFDYMALNYDRNFRNLLFKPAGDGHGIVAIDHGLTFGDTKFRPYRRFDGELAPDFVVYSLMRFQHDAKKQQALEDQLLNLLTPAETHACLARIEHIANLLESQGAFSRADLLDSDGHLCYDPREGGML